MIFVKTITAVLLCVFASVTFFTGRKSFRGKYLATSYLWTVVQIVAACLLIFGR